MGKSSPPPAPDFAAAAQQTSQGNLDLARSTTAANRVNYTTPFGSLTYTQPNPGNPDQWNANVSLSPDQQSLLDMNTQTQLGLGGMQSAALQRVENQPMGLDYTGVT